MANWYRLSHQLDPPPLRHDLGLTQHPSCRSRCPVSVLKSDRNGEDLRIDQGGLVLE